MIAGSKRVAYSRLPAERIIYSEEATEMGGKCGRRINLFPRNPDDEREPVEYTACKIEAFLWLGGARYAAACWSAIPPGYEIDHGRNVDTFPKYIEYNQSSVGGGLKRHFTMHRIFRRGVWFRGGAGRGGAGSLDKHCKSNCKSKCYARENDIVIMPPPPAVYRLQTFQLRAHVFQGRFEPGMDASGLLNSFVRVAFRGYTASTQVSDAERFNGNVQISLSRSLNFLDVELRARYHLASSPIPRREILSRRWLCRVHTRSRYREISAACVSLWHFTWNARE